MPVLKALLEKQKENVGCLILRTCRAPLLAQPMTRAGIDEENCDG
jgi:hypothetical protein